LTTDTHLKVSFLCNFAVTV